MSVLNWLDQALDLIWLTFEVRRRRVELNLNDHVHEMCRVLRLISALSRLGDLSKRPASLVLVWLSELALRPELREFPAKTLDARPSRPVVEC